MRSIIVCMPKRLEKISSVLNKTLSSRGLRTRLHEYRIVGRWEKIVGRVIAHHAQPVSLRGKNLVVAVDSSAWMQQLSMLKPELLAKLDAGLGAGAVRTIVFKIGNVTIPTREVIEPGGVPNLDGEEIKKIEMFVQEVRDSDIRASLQRLIEKDMVNKKKSRGPSDPRDGGSYSR